MSPATIAGRRQRPATGSCLSTSASNARMPPSPSLSARSTSSTYLMVTTSVIAQKIIDSTLKTASGVEPSPCSPAMLSLKAYSGLVPMSP